MDNPTNMPEPSEIDHMEEPIADVSIMTPDEYVGAVMEICQEKRGTFRNMEYLEENEGRSALRSPAKRDNLRLF